MMNYLEMVTNDLKNDFLNLKKLNIHHILLINLLFFSLLFVICISDISLSSLFSYFDEILTSIFALYLLIKIVAI